MLSKTTCINSNCHTVYVLGKIDGGEGKNTYTIFIVFVQDYSTIKIYI